MAFQKCTWWILLSTKSSNGMVFFKKGIYRLRKMKFETNDQSKFLNLEEPWSKCFPGKARRRYSSNISCEKLKNTINLSIFDIFLANFSRKRKLKFHTLKIKIFYCSQFCFFIPMKLYWEIRKINNELIIQCWQVNGILN